MNEIPISIVIPTFRRPDVLAKTLVRLENQTIHCKFEVILVNDGPIEELPELNFGFGKRTGWRLIQNEVNLKRAGTRNRGIRAAQGEFVIMLDDDIWAVPTLLQSHLNRQLEIGGGVVIGAVPPADTIEPTMCHRFIADRFNSIHDRLRGKSLDFGLFLTGNVSVPRKILLELGCFNERFSAYSFEDSELGYRLHRAGIRFVHEPLAIGYHRYFETETGLKRKAFESGRSLAVFISLHPECFRAMNCHSLVIGSWRGIDGVKNIVRFMLFNRCSFVCLQGVLLTARWLGLQRIYNRIFEILEIIEQARGYRTEKSLQGMKSSPS